VTAIAPGLWALELPNPGGSEGTVNAYLIRDPEGYALVDCGQNAPESWPVLIQQLAELRVPLDAIHTLVATHGHPDHAGASARLREHTPAQFLLHERDLDYMLARQGDSEPHSRVMADWLHRYGFPAPEVAEVLSAAVRANQPSPRPDRLLTGGEELKFHPYRFQVLWAPGHTPGHICLYEPDRRWLLCGDHILPGLVPNVGLQPFSVPDPIGSYTASLRQLSTLDVDLALPGHGPSMTNLAARAEEILYYQQRRRDQLLGLLTATPQTAYDLAAQVWPPGKRRSWATFYPRLRRNAIGTLAAHLERLAADRLIARHDDGVVRFSRLS
jgi:glyoxylase-like metal-dependent hydrolase (beta-lactamase superfamily II)